MHLGIEHSKTINLDKSKTSCNLVKNSVADILFKYQVNSLTSVLYLSLILTLATIS